MPCVSHEYQLASKTVPLTNLSLAISPTGQFKFEPELIGYILQHGVRVKTGHRCHSVSSIRTRTFSTTLIRSSYRIATKPLQNRISQTFSFPLTLVDLKRES